MSKNLNLKVDENMFYEFHRLKSLLRAGTNQNALSKMLLIVAERMDALKDPKEQENYIKYINTQMNK